MAQTVVGVVISTATRHTRRIIIPDDDSEMLGVQSRLKPGETLVQVPFASDLSYDALNATIAQQTGIAAPLVPRPTCVIIDTTANVVLNVIVADIALDTPSLPGTMMATNPGVSAGWVYNPVAKTLTSPTIAPTAQVPTPPALVTLPISGSTITNNSGTLTTGTVTIA
jgi:hypothetical protein